jgi:hypothetical protein
MRPALLSVLLVVLVVVVLLHAAGGWYFSGRINSGALAVRHPNDNTVRVLDVTERSITVQEAGEDPSGVRADLRTAEQHRRLRVRQDADTQRYQRQLTGFLSSS